MTYITLPPALSLRSAGLAATLVLAACSTQVQDAASAAYEPVFPVEDPSLMAREPTGSIYTAGSRGLFANDRRAASVGDILTVQFTEQMTATKSQSASGSKSSDFSVDLPGAVTGGFDDTLLSNGSDRSFKGQGAAAQSNSLKGRLSVIVVRELPGGNLEILGQKQLTLNNGNEYIRLRGIVRPEDISADNVILSDRIAAADIRYVGAGDVADTATTGWLHKLMATVSPL